MTELKKARRNLYEVIETGKTEDILEASREMDKQVLRLMHRQIKQKK